MKLQIQKRSGEKKSEVSKLRRAGSIPAVIYHKGQGAESISVLASDYNAAVRQVTPGRLSTTVFNLVDAGGKARKAILKEIQYHPTSYDILHMDFEELHDNVPVNVKVPIECTGVADCVGIKLGGSLRQVIRKVRVRCLPKDIPAAFTVDIRSMNVKDVRRLRDIEVGQTVKALGNPKEVAIAIVKR